MTKRKRSRTISTPVVALGLLCATAALAQDKYDLRVPDGLGFAEFKGYESWQVVFGQPSRRERRVDER